MGFFQQQYDSGEQHQLDDNAGKGGHEGSCKECREGVTACRKDQGVEQTIDNPAG